MRRHSAHLRPEIDDPDRFQPHGLYGVSAANSVRLFEDFSLDVFLALLHRPFFGGAFAAGTLIVERLGFVR